MKDAVVTLLKSSPNIKVSEMILGHSIETGANVIGGMLSDRFANPKFLGLRTRRPDLLRAGNCTAGIPGHSAVN